MAKRYYSLDVVIATVQNPMGIPGLVDDCNEWSDDELSGLCGRIRRHTRSARSDY